MESFIPHDVICDLRRPKLRTLEDATRYLPTVFNRPFERQEVIDLGQWILMLPPRKKRIKIGRRLRSIAWKRRATIHSISWWTMGKKGKRMVRLDLTRPDGIRLRVILTWKRRKYHRAERKHAPPIPHRDSWGRDVNDPNGWRFDMEGDVYFHIKQLFRAWLINPLPLLPTGAGQRTFKCPAKTLLALVSPAA